jgi:predicted ATP-binding protein involved in virulence
VTSAKKAMLPIALKSFHIKNYRGIIDTKVDDIPPDTQWIFLTGENGFGKTSVLQGIVKNLSGYGLSDLNFENFELEYFYKDRFRKNFHVEKSIRWVAVSSLYPSIERTIAYGSTRLRVSAGSSSEVMANYFSTESLFSNETLLINVEENFKDWKTNYKKGYEQLENIFKVLIPRLGKIEVDFDKQEKKSKVKYYETDEEGNIYQEGTEFLELAAGYKNIIIMVGDMIIRFSKYQQSKENFSDLEGIVLIDEIDLHLHPKYQKLFVQKLTELFPKIQFIVSTHSPIPLLGSPPNSVIINVSRTREDGIKAELLDIDFSVLTPNAILSSPIFGFQDLIPDSKSDDKMIRTEDTYKEVLLNDQLDKQISEYLTEDNQKELLDLLKVHNL